MIKIVAAEQKTNTAVLGEIDVGQPFMIEGSDDLYIKMHPVEEGINVEVAREEESRVANLSMYKTGFMNRDRKITKKEIDIKVFQRRRAK